MNIAKAIFEVAEYEQVINTRRIFVRAGSAQEAEQLANECADDPNLWKTGKTSGGDVWYEVEEVESTVEPIVESDDVSDI